ncbi:MAG: ATP synthase subunit C [Erysipelotrichaceae bacterium]|nr:ATP synthase subunit C [Erysipelotrichaceae bacterium]
MKLVEFILPLVAVVLLSLPLVKVFQGKCDVKSAKFRLATHVLGFFGAVALVFTFSIMTNGVLAEEATNPMTGTIAQGLGFVAAALSTGLAALGAGIAVSSAASAAIGAFSENPANFGRSLIFVALGEGVAIYGLLISILIINSL